MTHPIFFTTFFSRLNIFVPWNEVVVLDPVLLSRSGTNAAYGAGTSSQSNYFGIFSTEPSSKSLAPMTTCQDHDFTKMKPLVLATWKHGFQVSPKETILLEI